MFAKPMGLVVSTLKQNQWVDYLFYFLEPHSATENQRTDFSGIGLEMGKEASINNSSLPSFTGSCFNKCWIETEIDIKI